MQVCTGPGRARFGGELGGASGQIGARDSGVEGQGASGRTDRRIAGAVGREFRHQDVRRRQHDARHRQAGGAGFRLRHGHRRRQRQDNGRIQGGGALRADARYRMPDGGVHGRALLGAERGERAAGRAVSPARYVSRRGHRRLRDNSVRARAVHRGGHGRRAHDLLRGARVRALGA